MSDSTNKIPEDPEFKNIWDAAGKFHYSFESSNDDAWAKFSAERLAEKPKITFAIHQNFKRLIRVAAAFALLAVGSWAFYITQNTQSVSGNLSVQTNIHGSQSAHNDIKQIKLEDGTIITLNANSNIEYSLEKNVRRIKLIGMAHFEVAKNPNAPFIIVTANNRVTVLGTGFDVRSYPDKPLQVTVSHGKVKVEKLSAHMGNTADKVETSAIPLESVILTKGMRITEKNAAQKFKAVNYFTVETNVNLEAVNWQSGALSFENAPLADVISAVECRFHVIIDFPGNATALYRNNQKPRFTGRFKNTDSAVDVCKIVGKAMDLQLMVR